VAGSVIAEHLDRKSREWLLACQELAKIRGDTAEARLIRPLFEVGQFDLSGVPVIGENEPQIGSAGAQSERTQRVKCGTVIYLSALLALSATPDAFGWGSVSGPRGGAAYRGPMGGVAVRTPSGAAAVRTPSGAAAARGPYGGTAARGPVYGGGTVYHGTTVVTPGVGYGVAAGAAVGVAAGAAAGAAAASSSCYYPPYYCHPPAYYQPPAW
jgi:hypothetical protein